MNKFIYRKTFCLQIICMILYTLILLGCSSRKLEGNWNTSALLVEGKECQIFKSNIKFIYEGKKIVAKGRSGVNLYNAYVTLKGKKLKVTNMANTGLNGIPEAMEFENLFFEAFINADYYRIQGNNLHIYNTQKNLELILQR